MKRIIIIGCVPLALFAGQALADCTNSTLQPAAKLPMLFTGKVVCGSPGINYPGGANSPDRWQEEHRANGELWDYKLGNDPMDPSKRVGTWSIVGDKLVHTYIGGETYSWDVRMVLPTQVSFCVGSAEHARANLIMSTSGCGGIYPAGAVAPAGAKK